MDENLKKAGDASRPFGGFSICLVGYVRQLSPVCDTPLFHNPVEVTTHSTITIPAFSLYRKFKHIISLSQVLRQGTNEVILKEILERQGMGIYTESDNKFLRCRFINLVLMKL